MVKLHAAGNYQMAPITSLCRVGQKSVANALKCIHGSRATLWLEDGLLNILLLDNGVHGAVMWLCG